MAVEENWTALHSFSVIYYAIDLPVEDTGTVYKGMIAMTTHEYGKLCTVEDWLWEHSDTRQWFHDKKKCDYHDEYMAREIIVHNTCVM